MALPFVSRIPYFQPPTNRNTLHSSTSFTPLTSRLLSTDCKSANQPASVLQDFTQKKGHL
jgi:hypothetical protein